TRQTVGSGTGASTPPSSTSATTSLVDPTTERYTRLCPCDATSAHALRPTLTRRRIWSPSTRPPPSVLVYAQAAWPWLRGVRRRSGLVESADSTTVRSPTRRKESRPSGLPAAAGARRSSANTLTNDLLQVRPPGSAAPRPSAG